MTMFFAREENAANRPLLVFVLLSLLVGGSATFFTEPSIPCGSLPASARRSASGPPSWC